MKFKANAKAIADAMTSAQKVVERRNTYPILANVLIDAGVDTITLRSTDLDIELTQIVPAEVERAGITTLPAHMLSDILRKFDKGADVKFDMDDERDVKVTCGRSRFGIAYLHPDSFPSLSVKGNYSHEFSMSGKDLAEIIGRVSFAISNEETRYYLNGICFHAREYEGVAGMTFVATDGHRMVRYHKKIDGVEGMPQIIVPRKTVSELERLAAAAGDEALTFQIMDTRIRVTHGKTVLISKLIEGTFPDYERVTPQSNNKVALVDCQQLVAATDRVSTISSDRGGKAMKLTFMEGSLLLSVINPDHGEATDELPCNFGDDALEIGFNARYLTEVVTHLGKGEIRMSMSDSSGPALMTTDQMPGLKIVLMPMRV